MDDEAELQARIAALQGQIHKRKQAHQGPPHFQGTRGGHRWAPYARGGRGAFSKPHRNLTLVLAGAQPAQNETMADRGADAAAVAPVEKDAFIRNRGPKVNQLMKKEIFEREQKQRQELQEAQHTAKRPSHDMLVAKPVPQRRELEIDGIRFQVKDDGSKLIRIPDMANDNKETPKRAKVADVEFFRTKNGNLVRAAAQHGDRYCQERNALVNTQDSPFYPYRSVKRAPKPQCENFTKYGTCTFGPSCKFAHNPTKVAICKELMRSGSCQARKTCDMSHELTYHRVPACTHFLRGNCTNSACRYPHVHVSPTARVCRAFATLGFCAQGPDCDDRHVFECPDYANHGHCAAREKGSCSLQHIDRAGALRKAEKRQGKTGSEDDSDISSDDEEDEEEKEKQAAYDSSESDIDTDIEMGPGDFNHEQQDFLALS